MGCCGHKLVFDSLVRKTTTGRAPGETTCAATGHIPGIDSELRVTRHLRATRLACTVLSQLSTNTMYRRYVYEAARVCSDLSSINVTFEYQVDGRTPVIKG